MRLSVVVHLVGVLVRLFGPMLLVPCAVAAYYGEQRDAVGFAVIAAATIAIGHVMRRAGGPAAEQAAERLRRVEGMCVVAASWLIMAHIAGAPYDHNLFKGDWLVYGRVRDGQLEFEGLFEPWE